MAGSLDTAVERSPRRRLRADVTRTGAAWCRAQSDLIDDWLVQLLAEAVGASGRAPRVALVAVGGFGRRELCPESDLDVMLLHDRRADPAQVSAIADRLWYPIWDEGFHLGHSVCTVRQALALADDTLETATALLSARPLAGDTELSHELATTARQNWEKRSSRWLAALAAGVEARHQRAGEAAFRLEPDLKEARGGLRDVHALAWAQAARAVVLEYDEAPLAAAYSVLLDARVELQRRTGRAGNVLVLQEQDAVARALRLGDADELMAGIVAAARRIAWTSDDTWRRVASTLKGPSARTGQRPRPLGPGVALCDGEVTLDAAADPAGDATLALRVAVAAAGHSAVIERHALERLGALSPCLGDPPLGDPCLGDPSLGGLWPAPAASLLVQLLASGRPAIPVIEALDQAGVWGRILPEWKAVRSRPQRNAYHRFTVDRHLLEAVANAASLADRVARPDLLVLAALLHDMGKGQPGDHSTVGVGLARGIATRMGLPADDIETLECLVLHHLLLAEVASRRDLDDPVTIARVASALGTAERVALLAALTEADSLATGPSAWSPWKAGLVAELAARVTAVLSGGPGAGEPGAGEGEVGVAGGGLGVAGGEVGVAGGEVGVAGGGLGVSGGRDEGGRGEGGGLRGEVRPAADPGMAGPWAAEAFPSAQQRAWLTQPGRHVEAHGDVLTVVTADRPGVFCRIAGVVALHGLDVVAAQAHSSDDGRALAEFRVVDPVRGAIGWPRVVADVDLALDGRLALSARVAERRATYDRPGPAGPGGHKQGPAGPGGHKQGPAGPGGHKQGPAGPGGYKPGMAGPGGHEQGPIARRPPVATVGFDNAAASTATVIDVETVDRIGVLYRITRALTEMDLDIRSARVQTLGPDVVDSFYVRDEEGKKVTDGPALREIERAILHALDL